MHKLGHDYRRCLRSSPLLLTDQSRNCTKRDMAICGLPIELCATWSLAAIPCAAIAIDALRHPKSVPAAPVSIELSITVGCSVLATEAEP